jgi:hypothetical protein
MAEAKFSRCDSILRSWLIRPEVARTEFEKRLIDTFAQYVTTLGVPDGSASE